MSSLPATEHTFKTVINFWAHVQLRGLEPHILIHGCQTEQQISREQVKIKLERQHQGAIVHVQCPKADVNRKRRL